MVKQPLEKNEKISAYLAMIACPTGSIRLISPDILVKGALDAFPIAIDADSIPGVLHLGFHSSETYGATPYLIKRSSGNIMIDTPRYNSRLADLIEAEGGLRYIILTHRDDVFDHDRWKLRFPTAQRIMHRLDCSKYSKTNECEVLLEGEGQWEPDSGVLLIHTPGHTPGSICVHVRTDKEAVLFSGDTLAFSSTKKRLEGFKRYNSGSILAQASSIRELAHENLPFTWILPAHGRISRFGSNEEKGRMVLQAAADFEKEDEDTDVLGIGYY